MNTNTNPKLIAVDCDGTLFNSNGYPSAQTCDVIQRTVDAGHQVIAATGRSRHTAVDRLATLPGMRYLICSNGAYAWDVHASDVCWEVKMCVPQVTQIVTRLQNAFTDVAFNWESQEGFGWDKNFVQLAGGVDEMELGGVADTLCSQDLYKLKVRRPDVSTAALQEQLFNLLVHSKCTITTSGAPFLELSAPDAHKGAGLEKMASFLGFNASDTIVFGDNQNDVSMFEWAGTAVAMGNSIDELKAVATSVTLSNSEHGVAHYLEKMLDAGTL